MKIFSWFLNPCYKNTVNDFYNVEIEEIIPSGLSIVEEDLNTIILKITRTTITKSRHKFDVKGIYKGNIVGLQIQIKTFITNGINADGKINNAGFITKGIRLNTLGRESDAFIGALSEIFQYPTTKVFAKKSISATIFSLNQNTVNIKTPGNYVFKVILEKKAKELYSEILINLNTINGTIEFSEKDEKYRESLMTIFTS